MNDFDNPASCLETILNLYFFFSAWANMRRIMVCSDCIFRFFTGISCISTKILLGSSARFANSTFQNGLYLSDIMSIRSGYDDRQRESMFVYENVTFCSIFFPDQWDWDRLIPGQLALLSWSRQYSAISKRFFHFIVFRKSFFP